MAQLGMMQPLGDLLVIAIVLGMGAFGYRHGLFIATLSGFALLVSLVSALVVSGSFAEIAISLGCPEPYAIPVIFSAVLGGCLIGTRLLVVATVPENAARLPPLVDAGGGAFVGLAGGVVAAGSVLIGLSSIPLPADYRIDGKALRFDCGRMMLDTYAASLGAGEPRRQDIGRQYLEHAWDGTGSSAAVTGTGPIMPAGQAPIILTRDEIKLPEGIADGDTLVQVRTLRQGDPITFTLEPVVETGASALLTIDAVTGDIKVPDVTRLRQAGGSIDINLTATDAAGLSDEKTVTIVLQP